jgi:glycosyltransferase involved in cell wall biosynthesis
VNIVLINHYAGSPEHGMEYRPHQLARHWVAAGHEVTIVAGSFSHLRHRNPDFKGRVGEEFIDGIRYRWLRTPQYQGNGLGRIRSIHAFLRAVDRERRTIFRTSTVDAVIASSTYPFDIDPARRIAREHDATLVWEVHDLWPLSPIELRGYSPRHPLIRITQRAEDRCCRDADLVVSILPLAIDHLTSRGLDPERYVAIPNGAEPVAADRTIDPIPMDRVQAHRRAGRFTIGYAGGHGSYHALDVLLRAVAAVPGDRLAVILIGDGDEKGNLRGLASSLGLHHVEFLDRVDRASAMAALEASDAIYAGLQAHPIYRFGIGLNKLFDAMLAGRPLIGSYTAGNDPIREADCGVRVEAGDIDGLAREIDRLIDLPGPALTSMGMRGRDFVRRNHDYRRLSRRFLDEIERCRFDSRGASS